MWKQWAQTALKNEPKTPFVAPPGIRWVRIDRATGKRVYGVFPTTEEPKSPVIWEAFQPQTEPRRSFRHRREGAEMAEQALEGGQQQRPAQRPAAPRQQYQQPAPVEAWRPQPAPLQNTAAAQ